MKQLIKTVSFCIMLFCLESCFTQKQLVQALVNISGAPNLCVSRPISVDVSHDANNGSFKVRVTISNTNNFDVQGSLQLQIDVRTNPSTGYPDGILFFSSLTTPTGFITIPKNSTYTSKPILIDVGEEAARAGNIWNLRIHLIKPAFSGLEPVSSCNQYDYPYTVVSN